jgi:hypothetical protein
MRNSWYLTWRWVCGTSGFKRLAEIAKNTLRCIRNTRLFGTHIIFHRMRNSVLEIRYWRFGAGDSVLESQYCIFGTGDSALAIRCWKVSTRDSVLEMRYWIFGTGDSAPAIRCWRVGIRDSVLDTHHWIFHVIPLANNKSLENPCSKTRVTQWRK